MPFITLYSNIIMKFNAILIASLCATTLFTSCKKDDETGTTPTPVAPEITYGEMELEFEHTFGTANFAFNTAFTTDQGEEVNFSTLKYYVSNITLHHIDGSSWKQPESYYLVDLSTPSTAMLHLHDVPTGDYSGITFTLGVDSTRNVSGAQEGALSVANNMFWSWNSGYIFAKFEGTSPQSSTGGFSYHCGGFQGENKALQEITFDFTPATLRIRQESAPVVHLMADIKNIFDQPGNQVSTAALGSMHMPGPNAKKIMSNFAAGIAFDHIHN